VGLVAWCVELNQTKQKVFFSFRGEAVMFNRDWWKARGHDGVEWFSSDKYAQVVLDKCRFG
jgi:hypothetical protein